MIEQLIAEATECDFKVALETKKYEKKNIFIYDSISIVWFIKLRK